MSRDYDSTVPRPSEGAVEGGGSFTGCPRGSDWCGTASASYIEAQSGPRISLAHRICREAAGTQDHLTFDTTQEAEFEIWSGGRLVWRWSDGATVATQAHRLDIDPGACLTWSTGYDARDLQPGDYEIRAWVTAEELGPQATYRAEVTVEE